MQGTDVFVNAQTSSGRAHAEPPNAASREDQGGMLSALYHHPWECPPHSSSESYPQVMIQNKNTIKKNKNSPSDGLQDWIRLRHVDTSQGML